AALAATKPPVIPDPGGKSNFIAAARRAAQAASSEASRADKPTASAAPTPDGKAGKAWTSRMKAVLVAASVVVILLGSLHMVASLFASAEPEHAAPPDPPRVTSPEPAPDDAAKPNPDAAEPAPGRQSLFDPQPPASAIAVLPPMPPAEAAPPPAAVP